MSEQPQIPIKGKRRIISIDRLHPNEWNYNEQNDFIFAKEIESIRTNGFIKAVTARKHPRIPDAWEIIDGEHRFLGCKELGMTEISIDDLGEVPDEVAKKLTIILNETKGEPDRVKLGKLFKDLDELIGRDALAAEMPFKPEEIEGMIKALDFDWNAIDQGAAEATQQAADADPEPLKITLECPQEAREIVTKALRALKDELPELSWKER
jgi:ParB-like chromosome segregation protein Spo0J